MQNDNIVYQLFKELSEEDKLRFIKRINVEQNVPTTSIKAPKTFTELMMERRYKEILCCPKCGNTDVVKHGFYKNREQRYLCNGCHKHFALTYLSVFHYHKKDMNTMLQYIRLMSEGYTLTKAAKICKISLNTSFAWRHKFIDALKREQEHFKLSGIVEADETFTKLSFKGLGKKIWKNKKGEIISEFKSRLPREARKRGNDNHTRGLGDELVCIPTALDLGDHRENSGTVMKPTNLGNAKFKDIECALSGTIEKGSLLVTDKKSAYVKFTENEQLNLIQLKEHQSVKTDNFNISINHINNMHQRLKRFINNFQGVSTKYIENYLTWFSLIHQKKSDDYEEMLLTALSNNVSEERTRDIIKRPIIPFKNKYDGILEIQGIFNTKTNKG